MRVLLTGATGYIGKRLLPLLVGEGHTVICCVRDAERFHPPKSLQDSIEVVEVDFLNEQSLVNLPQQFDAAYYLIHSMSSSSDFQAMELSCAKNFNKGVVGKGVKQVIYLSGMVNSDELSEHLDSRKRVEEELGKAGFALTTLRAGIVIGSGSASFEIIRDLVEKLPVMVAPRWLNTRCQPIGIKDVLTFLSRSLGEERMYNDSFDIGGPDVLTYKEMLLGYAKARGLWRWIGIVPVMTPRLSSYWLYFITSTSYSLAISLVDSMKVEVVAKDARAAQLLGITPLSYANALERTLLKVDRHEVISSWKDASVSSHFDGRLSEFIQVPSYGCFRDQRSKAVANRNATLEKIWSIGGDTGWYAANALWRIRGYMDKLVGGVGLRRGRTHAHHVEAGDAIDFWRVLLADKEEGRLLLFAEMKLPGEAWLEFRIKGDELIQTATFRPKGVWGRLYWYVVIPLHGIVFQRMLNALASAPAKTLGSHASVQ